MSSQLDLLVRGGTLVLPVDSPEAPAGSLARADFGIREGRIALISPASKEPAAEILDASGFYVFPGILDAHVHFNEPGREEWEGLASGSAALAAAGGTGFFDMPLNSLPPVLDGASFAAKRAAAERHSILDFALWGGLVPGNLDSLEEMAQAGAIGFKAFLCDSGMPEFPAVTDDETLREGMQIAAALGLPVAVHAEDDALVRRATDKQKKKGRDAESWLASRPVAAELRSIERVLALADETGCALHIVHVSSPEGLALITAAQEEEGVDVTAETCPHYLLLNDADVLRLGAVAKCAPPLRSEENRRGLWKSLLHGDFSTIGSDHSPAPPELKASADFFEIWGGISGCQHGFPLLLTEAMNMGGGPQALPRLAALLASNVARRFRLDEKKGRIAVGLDADFSLLRIGGAGEGLALSNGDLLYRHRQGPYEGRISSVEVVRTFQRGHVVHDPAAPPTDRPKAEFLRPQP